jgi:hypothetical protein
MKNEKSFYFSKVRSYEEEGYKWDGQVQQELK